MDESEAQKDWLTADFDFALPQELIAAAPIAPRDQARLLHVQGCNLSDRHVCDLPDILKPTDLLVINDTKVIPARLYGTRGAMKAEILLHRKLEAQIWTAFARPGKRLRIGDTIQFAPDFAAHILEKRDGGEVVLEFAAGLPLPLEGRGENREAILGRGESGRVEEFPSHPSRTPPPPNPSQQEGGDCGAFFACLEKYGHVPLPPYIKRPQGDTSEDRTSYQTIYAAHKGAVAAPTAGLHFTPELFARLDAKGIERVKVTLHVGAGTFLPVKADHIKDHHMHAEWGEITPTAAAAINQAKKEGRRIVSVGTTPLRLMETVAAESGLVRPFTGETSIFIYPGYRFKCVDALMTNFHLPKSTLFMLVSAFAGLENMQSAYAHAIKERYRFYSYGDTSLLEKK
jgi:S-adenosylmethionine:tRNA ribosyltransferase-isomerase